MEVLVGLAPIEQSFEVVLPVHVQPSLFMLLLGGLIQKTRGVDIGLYGNTISISKPEAVSPNKTDLHAER
jgi:hypothetical protein